MADGGVVFQIIKDMTCFWETTYFWSMERSYKTHATVRWGVGSQMPPLKGKISEAICYLKEIF